MYNDVKTAKERIKNSSMGVSSKSLGGKMLSHAVSESKKAAMKKVLAKAKK